MELLPANKRASAHEAPDLHLVAVEANRPLYGDRIFAAIPFVLAFAHGLRPRLARGLALAEEFTMRSIGFLTALVFFLLVGETSAISQTQPRNQPPPAKPAPYKIVAVKPPQPMNDAALEALRKQIGEAAQKKDRAALAKLVVAEGFFWERENGDRADKRKSGADNFGAALGLNNKDDAGWDMLASIADDPTGSPSTEHKGAVCAPADPTFDVKAFNDLMQATKTDPDEWAYPVSANARYTPAGRSRDRQTSPRVRARHAGKCAQSSCVPAHCHAGRQDGVCVRRLHRADRQRPDLLC